MQELEWSTCAVVEKPEGRKRWDEAKVHFHYQLMNAYSRQTDSGLPKNMLYWWRVGVIGACNQRGIERLVSNSCMGIGCDKIFAWPAPLVLSRHALQLVHFMRRQLIASH